LASPHLKPGAGRRLGPRPPRQRMRSSGSACSCRRETASTERLHKWISAAGRPAGCSSASARTPFPRPISRAAAVSRCNRADSVLQTGWNRLGGPDSGSRGNGGRRGIEGPCANADAQPPRVQTASSKARPVPSPTHQASIFARPVPSPVRPRISPDLSPHPSGLNFRPTCPLGCLSRTRAAAHWPGQGVGPGGGAHLRVSSKEAGAPVHGRSAFLGHVALHKSPMVPSPPARALRGCGHPAEA
jgi:hypothetical protein